MTGVYFSEQKQGYDREEVGVYIDKLAKAYQAAYDENQAVNAKYSELLREYDRLKSEREAERHEVLASNANILAKTLLDARTLAQRVIDDARIEAGKNLDEARRSKEAADTETQRVIRDAQDRAATIMEQAWTALVHARDALDQTLSESRELTTGR